MTVGGQFGGSWEAVWVVGGSWEAVGERWRAVWRRFGRQLGSGWLEEGDLVQ